MQWDLISTGQPLVWFDDVTPDSLYFDSAQLAATLGLIELRSDSLKFGADEVITGNEAGAALHKLSALKPGLLRFNADSWAQSPMQWTSLARFGYGAEQKNGPVKRGDFTQWLVAIYLKNWNALAKTDHRFSSGAQESL